MKSIWLTLERKSSFFTRLFLILGISVLPMLIESCVGQRVYLGKDKDGKDRYAYKCDPTWCGETYTWSDQQGSSCYNTESGRRYNRIKPKGL